MSTEEDIAERISEHLRTLIATRSYLTESLITEAVMLQDYDRIDDLHLVSVYDDPLNVAVASNIGSPL